MVKSAYPQNCPQPRRIARQPFKELSSSKTSRCARANLQSYEEAAPLTNSAAPKMNTARQPTKSPKTLYHVQLTELSGLRRTNALQLAPQKAKGERISVRSRRHTCNQQRPVPSVPASNALARRKVELIFATDHPFLTSSRGNLVAAQP